MTFAMVSAALIAIAATVLLFIKVLPAKYDGTFSKKIFPRSGSEHRDSPSDGGFDARGSVQHHRREKQNRILQ